MRPHRRKSRHARTAFARDRLYRKKNGTVWYGYYYKLDGSREYVCTKQQDRNAARAVLREMEREANGTPSARQLTGETGHLIADALQYLLDCGAADVSDDTKDMYRLHMGHSVRVLTDRDVGKFTIDDSQEYIPDAAKGRGASGDRKELVTLRRGLTLAHERKILAMDPRGLIPKFRVRYVPKDRFLTAEFSWIMQALASARRL